MDNKTGEDNTELVSVKDMLGSYKEFKANVQNYYFYSKKMSDTETVSCAHDVEAQIDDEEGSRIVTIDTIKIQVMHNGELLKSFSKPIEPRIEYAVDVLISVDGEELQYSFNLKELKLYMKDVLSTIWSVIMTDGKKYIRIETYNNIKKYDKRDELLWPLILCWECNFFVDRAYLQYVEQQERMNSSGNSFMSLFGTSSGRSSLNTTKKIENGYEELDKLIGLEGIKKT